jgi:hypothetical protein
MGFVAQIPAVREAIARETDLAPGGDGMRSLGLLVTQEGLEEISEEVIVL